MDAQSEQIVRTIQDKRDQLSDNLAALETRMREATNWRTYYNRNPWLMLGAAMVGGILAAAVVTPARRRR